MKTHDINTRRELFVDRELIDQMDAARPRLHPPQPREMALTCDQPREENGPGYTTVIQDGETNVCSLATRPVRLRIELKDADLFSFQFV